MTGTRTKKLRVRWVWIKVACHWSKWHGKDSDWTEIKRERNVNNWAPKMVSMTIGGCWDGWQIFMILYAQIWKYWNANIKAEARGEMKSPYKEILVARRSKTDRVESRQKSGIERQRKTERKQSRFEGKMYKWARKRAESISKDEGVTFRHTPPVIYLAEEITKNGRKASRYTPGRKISMHTKPVKQKNQNAQNNWNF